MKDSLDERVNEVVAILVNTYMLLGMTHGAMDESTNQSRAVREMTEMAGAALLSIADQLGFKPSAVLGVAEVLSKNCESMGDLVNMVFNKAKAIQEEYISSLGKEGGMPMKQTYN